MAAMQESPLDLKLWHKVFGALGVIPRSNVLVERKQKSRLVAFHLLLQCFALQIRYGCENKDCKTLGCFSCRRRNTSEPVRRPTLLAARNQAFVLASTDDPLSYLCPNPLRTDIDGDERVDTNLVRAYVLSLQNGDDAMRASQAAIQGQKRGDDPTSSPSRNGQCDDSSEDKHAKTNTTQTKVDRASLVQNLFNTNKMAYWFDSQCNTRDNSKSKDLDVMVFTELSRELAMAIATALTRISGSYRDRFASITDLVVRSIRYNFSSPSRLLEQWSSPGPQIPIASLSRMPFKEVLDTDGNVINSIVAMDKPHEHLRHWTALPAAFEEMLTAMWNALDALLVPPPRIAGSKNNTLGTAYVSDDQAARMIFIAILLLIVSIPKSDSTTLSLILAKRSLGGSVVGYSSETEFNDTVHMRNNVVLVSDAFEYPLSTRLAEKVVAALAVRRSYWCALRVEGSEVFPVMYLVMAYMNRLVFEAISPDDGQGTWRFEVQRLHRVGRSPGPILLEWLKTVFRIGWKGEHVVDRWKGAGSALEIMNDLYQMYNSDPKGWVPDDSHFVIPLLGAHLKPHKIVPDYLAWMAANPPGSKRYKNERHLLQFPFLFEPMRRMHNFRLMLYHQMHHEWRRSRAVRELHNHFSWLITPGSSDYRCIDERCNHAMCERLRFQNRQPILSDDARHGSIRRLPSHFWNRDLYLRNRLDTSRAKFLILDIERQSILESTFDQLWGREHRELLKPLKIVMRMDGKDEDAADHGGVSQEFFRLVLAKAFEPEYGLFVVTEEQTKMNWFKPLSLEPLQTYELLGLLFGMAVYNGITLPVNLPFAMYQVLCGRGPFEQFVLQDAWPSLHKSFQQLTDWREEDGDVEEIFARDYAFSFEANGQTYTIDMLNDDSTLVDRLFYSEDSEQSIFTDMRRSLTPVTYSNRIDFISDYKKWLVFNSVRPQLEAFVKGFRHIISITFTSFITSPTLQRFVEGTRQIDASLLKAATSYAITSPETEPSYSDEYSSAHPTIQHFWSVVMNYDQVQLQKLLTFVTASDRVPVQGYRAIGFSIEKHGDVNMLPTSSTCFGKLFLPPYESEEAVSRMLGIAIEEGTSGFGFM
ncbi:uncharacterized protein PV09_04484 [Verruconis gallopava]|uniref:HECT-type E3 ubiquitin transferase n=1 Tax=Verruconis gallopava TaxID=253628 RepID=A0A0D2ABH5_9PEZI|nr:uncharacterized protein PV09_04484 [Verruconis gallopava]KIW04168.1 hypothetical protein PV09_04484 [Verruconis gallopava]